MKNRIILGSILLALLVLFLLNWSSTESTPVEVKLPIEQTDQLCPEIAEEVIVVPEKNQPVIQKKKARVFLADLQKGAIGSTTERPVDEAFDNVFHFNLDIVPNSQEEVWLTYELKGVQDHTAISRSINNRQSVGGYLIQPNQVWSTQREQISPDWLRKGDNVVRFSFPPNTNVVSEIRNLKIETKPKNQQNNNYQLVLNHPSDYYHNNQTYVKGFLKGEGKGNAQVSANGVALPNTDGEFEFLLKKETYFGKDWTIDFLVQFPNGKEVQKSTTLKLGDMAQSTVAVIPEKERPTRQMVEPKQNQICATEGLTLTIPKTALLDRKEISITPLRPVDLAPIPAEIVNVTPNKSGFRLLPHGTRFQSPVSIEMEYDPKAIPEGYTADDIRTYFFDEVDRKWKPIAKVEVLADNHLLKSQTTHFTDFINGIIKVPESPETNGYTPNSIKDLKAADPSAKVNQIQAPQANNQGTANLFMPIEIPAGRNGMQPQISINYNNEGGNGWLGLGWDLSMPAISIETRWGVPRYDTDLETETYLLNGEQMTPVAHREEWVARNMNNEKNFYRRVEGAFDRIIRHGNSPNEYYWTVTDKNGTTNYYGGTPNGEDNNSVLKTNTGNIAHWCLTMTEDANGNFVRYYYDTEEHSGVAGSPNMGRQIYISHIEYTGHANAAAKYSVEFFRNQDRPDVNINCRLGFKQVTADLLQRIEVKYEEEMIRSYDLVYDTGAFFKTLLVSCTQNDRNDTLFTTHEFAYFDEVRNGGVYEPLSNEVNISVVNDDIKVDFKNPISDANIGEFGGESTILSSSKSKNKSIGGALTIGVGGNIGSKVGTVGGRYNRSTSDGEGLITLIDINGDTKPDKLYQKGDGLFYRPNLVSFDDLNLSFGDEIPIEGGISEFSSTKTKTTSKGFEAHPLGVFIGRTKTKSKTKTNTYLVDANGDGLIDVCKKGNVFFNHYNSDNDIEFINNSNLTPNPVTAGAAISQEIMVVDSMEQDNLIDEFPLYDVVRMWEAPFTGFVTIDGAIQLIEDTLAVEYYKKDGIRASIQYDDTVLDSIYIDSTNYTVNNFTTLPNTIEVTAGKKIYFRLQSRQDGAFDHVMWNPEIQYLDSSIPHSEIDANNNPFYKYRASDDFLLSSCQSTIMPIEGEITINSNFVKPITSDDIIVEILRIDTLEVIFRDTFEWDEEINTQINTMVSVFPEYEILFKVSANTNIDWAAISWNPQVFYSDIPNNNIPLLDSDGLPLISFCPAVEYTMFNKIIEQPKQFIFDSLDMDANVKVFFNVDFIESPMPMEIGTITFSAKGINKFYKEISFLVEDGALDTNNPVLEFELPSGDSILYLDCYISNPELAEEIMSVEIINFPDAQPVNNDGTIGIYTKNYPDNMKYGNLYRGWGQFGYNGNREKAFEPINQDSLIIILPSDAGDINGDASNFQSNDDQTLVPFHVFIADPKTESWRGNDEFAFVKAASQSSSRLGEDDIIVDNTFITVGGTGLSLPTKFSKSENVSFAGNIGFSILGLSGSKSNGETKNIIDVFDVNGDRYPEIIGEGTIQYTLPTGGLSENPISFSNLNNHKSESEAKAFGLGGTFVQSASFNSGQPNINSSEGTVNYIQSGSGSGAGVSFGVPLVGGGLSMNANAAFGKASATVGVSYNEPNGDSDDHSTVSWMDINGDGLIDQVFAGGQVMLNLGYEFSEPENWGFDEIKRGENEDYSAGGNLGGNFGNNSVSVGLSLSRTDNFATHSLQDVNGDGLVDIVLEGNPFQVRLNTGNYFENAIPWTGASFFDRGSSTGEALSGTFTICFIIPIPFAPIKICINPQGSIGQGISRQETQITDLDGDGYPDILSSTNNGELKVKRSTIGKTNLLKSVQRPMGSSFTIDYDRVGNTYEMPQSKWVLKEVETFDGLVGDGADYSKMSYEYEDGFQNRHERAFYGFATLRTHQLDTENNDDIYRTTTYTYDNSTYYRKGLLLNQKVEDGNGNPYLATQNTYTLKTLNGNTLLDGFEGVVESVYPALSQTVELFYEGNPDPGLTHTINYAYDNIGNITRYEDLGDGTTQDEVTAEITYHSDLVDEYIVASPSKIEVKTNGELQRHRETDIDDKGNVTQIRQYLNASVAATYDMTYDDFGNLETIHRPLNVNEEQMSFAYTYDDAVQTYVTSVQDAYGYTSSSVYEYLFGQMLESTDLNGQQMVYTIDDVGRISTITGPYELANEIDYTIAFDYDHTAVVPYAHTRHYDPETEQDIETYTFMDGLQRPVQVKKTGVIAAADGLSDELQLIVSGRVRFDAFGRTTTAHYPTVEPTSNATAFNPTVDAVTPTRTEFDVLDRPRLITLPDGATTETVYAIETDNVGFTRFHTHVTDPLMNIRETYTDIRKRQRATTAHGPAGEIWTNFDYNAISELEIVTDHAGNETTYQYDKLGRKIEMTHPDMGLTEFKYDLANNLTEKITAEIRNSLTAGSAIRYTYDKERLIQIDYPRNYQNRVTYHYGDTTAQHNRVGRIWLQEDASGGQEFFYGPLGETIKNIRTIVVDPITQLTYVSEFKYDTWNRLQEMIYPDGEVVTYDYNRAGKLIAMQGEKENRPYPYVNQLRYDKFEQRTFLEYGNGTTTHYQYEEDRRRLQNLQVMGVSSDTIMNNNYQYDLVDNIVGIMNDRGVPSNPILGGMATQNYKYDKLYRLVEADGTYAGHEITASYDLKMQYDNLHNIVNKEQMQVENGDTTSYNLAYNYGGDLPHVPDTIGTTGYTYDANGNQTGWIDSLGRERETFWDEENRIKGIVENGIFNQNTYDAAGERVIKSESKIEGAFINGGTVGYVNHGQDYFLYVSPYLVAKRNGDTTATRFTKHYFIEGQRVTSKLGLGKFDNNMLPPNIGITAGNKNYLEKLANFDAATDAFPLDIDTTGFDFTDIPLGDYDRPTDRWPRLLALDSVPPGHPTLYPYDSITNDNVFAGYGFSGHNILEEADQFFYHPDHLGSASYLTDKFGMVRQHIEYTPFGETFVSEHTSDNTQPYLFNGKELDANTGLYYYGARYYDPRTSMWQSVDPLMEKYAGWSPYNYTLLNPVRYVDPDGRNPIERIKRIKTKFSKLNGDEQRLVIRHPKAAQVMDSNSKRAGKIRGKGGTGDAKRHMLFQALNTQVLGEETTRKFADAHELSTPLNEIDNHIPMDIHNNELGIEIGKNNPLANEKELSSIIDGKINRGEAVILDKEGNLTPSNGDFISPVTKRGLKALDIGKRIKGNNEGKKIYKEE